MNNQVDVCKCGIVSTDCEYHKAEDYCKIEEVNGTRYYYNEKGQRHSLLGPAVAQEDGDGYYCINGILYMSFSEDINKAILYPSVLGLMGQYGSFIEQNIKALIEECCPLIELKGFNEEQIGKLPTWLNDYVWQIAYMVE